MEKQELRERIIMLSDRAGLLVIDEDEGERDCIAANRCWLDAGACPYGEPQGRFDLRPTQFCSMPSDKSNFGCHKLLDARPELHDALGVSQESIGDYFEKHHTGVDTELDTQAAEIVKEDEADEPESLILQLAADILRKSNRNRDILLEEDLPDRKNA